MFISISNSKMKSYYLLCACILLFNCQLVPGIFLPKLKQTFGKVRCGLHQLGKSIVPHEHLLIKDPCQDEQDSTTASSSKFTLFISNEYPHSEQTTVSVRSKEEITNNAVSPNKPTEENLDEIINNFFGTPGTPVAALPSKSNTNQDSRNTPNPKSNEADAIPKLDIRGEIVTSTEKDENVTVPGGRRIIKVGTNCPEGYVADTSGDCREEV